MDLVGGGETVAILGSQGMPQGFLRYVGVLTFSSVAIKSCIICVRHFNIIL